MPLLFSNKTPIHSLNTSVGCLVIWFLVTLDEMKRALALEFFEHFGSSKSIVCLLCHLGGTRTSCSKGKQDSQVVFFAHVTSVKFLIYDPRQCIAVKAKKMDPPGPKQTNEVHNYVGNRTQSEYRASKKRAVLTSFLFVRQGTSEVSELYTIKTKQIKGGHLDLLNRTFHKQETFL